MSKNQTIQEFDENFFSSFAVPKVKDYSRLSSSPSRDQPCESSYFEKHFPNLECDTPVKMRMPQVERDSNDALPTANLDNFLSSSSSSESTVTAIAEDTSGTTTAVKPNAREPLKIVPNEAAAPASYGESQLIEGLEKLTMFAPKAPEERLSQRRRSEQRKKQEEETKRRSVLPGFVPPNRARSISSSKRSVSREPSVVRESSIPRVPRHNSVTRTISAPIAGGVVTRAMAARAAETCTTTTTSKPIVRRSVMPLKVAQKTPVSQMKKDAAAPGSGDRSRDRTRRTNTTGASRRSVMPVAPAGSSTPIAPPRRSASANKTSASKITPKTRPIATANRSSILRMNMIKPTAPPASLAAETDAQQKRMITRPAVPPAGAARTRQPLRVNPTTPSSTVKKPALQSSAPRPARQPLTVTRTRSVDRVGQQPPGTTGTPSQKTSRSDLFNRLATPKAAATPARVSHDGPSSSIRKSAVRPVPSYVYSVNKGMPSAGGLHGIRAPSKERFIQKVAAATAASEQTKQ